MSALQKTTLQLEGLCFCPPKRRRRSSSFFGGRVLWRRWLGGRRLDLPLSQRWGLSLNPPASYCSSESPAALWAYFGFINTYLDHCHRLLFDTPQLGLGETDIKEILLTLTWDTHAKSVLTWTYITCHSRILNCLENKLNLCLSQPLVFKVERTVKSPPAMCLWARPWVANSCGYDLDLWAFFLIS